jgi:uncharacterized protein (TIGR00251 family)
LIAITDHPSGATFSVRVQPRGGRSAITGVSGEVLKVALSAPPVDGRANDELAEYFSQVFLVPRGSVQVVTGERSRNKVVRIAGRSAAELALLLRERFTV